ncbi:MarR family winged helix-turn-helix transcriptional regulator [Pleomorphovibrio marinus]|uniref:MarR family winged helix-turn-helix transcriptional regulator n=1 Tax=Pleomorphovibrio marinus TaxID=2164132 RepID=UPI001E5131D3|nr:MarR family transcriptional regulator [Pleomorphovibrio marinus]
MTKKSMDKIDAGLEQTISSLSREFSTLTILLHQAIAQKAGLTGTDHKYVDLLMQHGPMTAGKLSALSGLTTGAVTGLIDRLEKSNLVTRERDPQDRRKVLVVLNQEVAFQKIGPAFQAMQSSLEKFYQKFEQEELLAVKKYLEAVNAFTKEQIALLNGKS